MTEIPLPVRRPHPSLLPGLDLKLCACKFSVTELNLQPFLSFGGGGGGEDRILGEFPRLAWSSPSSCLCLNVGITGMCHLMV